jgi:hypothetical protein
MVLVIAQDLAHCISHGIALGQHEVWRNSTWCTPGSILETSDSEDGDEEGRTDRTVAALGPVRKCNRLESSPHSVSGHHGLTQLPSRLDLSSVVTPHRLLFFVAPFYLSHTHAPHADSFSSPTHLSLGDGRRGGAFLDRCRSVIRFSPDSRSHPRWERPCGAALLSVGGLVCEGWSDVCGWMWSGS